MPKLKPADFESVRDAVKKFESLTRGELVPLVVADAADFSGIRYQTGLIGFGISLVGAEAWSYFRSWPLDGFETAVILSAGAAIGTALGLVPMIARFVYGKAKLAKVVHQRSLAEFTEYGCANTKERIGILVMVALFERRIEIVADRGIQAVVIEKEGADVWSKVTTEFASSAREGKAVEGLIAVIERLTAVVARHFPANGARENELSDELRTEE